MAKVIIEREKEMKTQQTTPHVDVHIHTHGLKARVVEVRSYKTHTRSEACVEDTVDSSPLDCGAGGNGRDGEDSEDHDTIAQEHHQHCLVEPSLTGRVGIMERDGEKQRGKRRDHGERDRERER